MFLLSGSFEELELFKKLEIIGYTGLMSTDFFIAFSCESFARPRASASTSGLNNFQRSLFVPSEVSHWHEANGFPRRTPRIPWVYNSGRTGDLRSDHPRHVLHAADEERVFHCVSSMPH